MKTQQAKRVVPAPNSVSHCRQYPIPIGAHVIALFVFVLAALPSAQAVSNQGESQF
jgi:hypothetical protein